MRGIHLRDMNLKDVLIDHGILTGEQAEKAVVYAKSNQILLADAICQLHLASKEQIYTALADSLGVPYVDISHYVISPDCLKLISQETARRYRAIPIFKIKDVLTVAMEDPAKLAAADRMRNESKLEIDLCLAAPEDIREALDRYYGVSGTLSKLLTTLDAEERMRGRPGSKKGSGTPLPPVMPAGEQPVIKLVNLIIEQAIEEGASDIHIEPEENDFRIRYRIDGVLHETPPTPKSYESAIVSRLKVMANLDIAETRIPQDGQITLDLKGHSVNIRVSVLPTIYGQNVVLRLLNTTKTLLDLKQLGFTDDMRREFEEMIHRSYGMILVTGPTGSGKTTTLYSALNVINTVERNIVTIEDPVEYKLSLIRPIQVNLKANLTFATGLRSIVRQDPDIIMVGEIRDSETAKIAIQAALTGHLVFSTLHTQNASGVVTRLDDMGVEPFLVSSSLLCVVAQRLVRLICKNCKKTDHPPASMLTIIPPELRSEMSFYKGKGCPRCHQTGFRGRIGIFELLKMTEKIRRLVSERAMSSAIQSEAEKEGMKPFLYDGLLKVRDGFTTMDEVIKTV